MMSKSGCIPFFTACEEVTPIAPPTGCGIRPVPNRNLYNIAPRLRGICSCIEFRDALCTCKLGTAKDGKRVGPANQPVYIQGSKECNHTILPLIYIQEMKMLLQLIHILALSPQIMVYGGCLLSTYSCGIRVLSAMGYGVRPEHSRLAAVLCSTLIISLRLAIRASLSSPFSSPCCVGSHCSAFLSS